MHSKSTLLASFFAIWLGASLDARADVLAQYLVPDANFVAPTTTLAGLTASSIDITGSDATIQPDPFLNQFLIRTTKAGGGALASNQYFQFTITPDLGAMVTLNSLSFAGGYEGTGGVADFHLTSSLSNFMDNNLSGIFNAASFANSTQTANFGTIVLTGPITFRIYSSTPSANEGVFYDTITVNGTVGSGVPAQPVCGNAIIESGESCDDGNTNNGDGCSSTCQAESPAQPVCGNGIVESGEGCDDGNTIDGDGCSATCQSESPPTQPQCGVGAASASFGAGIITLIPFCWSRTRCMKRRRRT